MPCTSDSADTSAIPTYLLASRSSDANLTLPSNKSDDESVSDLSSENIYVDVAFTSPSLQLSPPTPDFDESEVWVLVDGETKSNCKQLPSDSEFCPNNTSPNSSFLYSDRLTSRSSSTLGDLSRSSSEGSPLMNRANGSEEVALRNKGSTKLTRGSSWSGDSETRHSCDSESHDGLNSTGHRRISFFGSFGKGSKSKEKSRSFFYDYKPDEHSLTNSLESNSNSMTSLHDQANITSNISHSALNQSLSVSSFSSGRDSNRSSMSDESIDQKSEVTIQESEVDTLDRRRTKCRNVVNEVMTSEQVFIDALTLLCVDFKKALENASNGESPIIPDSEFKNIIKHLPELLSLNRELLIDIESRIKSWDESPKMADVFIKKGPFLKLYSSYFQDFLSQVKLLEECREKYPKFGQVVTDFEKSDRCEKLSLQHYMLKPVQRLTQYRLLLSNYKKYQEPDFPDYADTEIALEIINGVVNHADSSLKTSDTISKLLSIQERLSDFEVLRPGRYFVKEGELYKLCRKDMQLRYFILLSDCLLYTSYYSSMAGLKLRLKLPLLGMKVFLSRNIECDRDFSVITSARSFTLRAKDKDELKAWVEALQTTVQDYTTRQMTFDKHYKPTTNTSTDPLRIGRVAPVWVQDSRVTMCQRCASQFGLIFRRHHCRACGKVVCSNCLDYSAPMLYRRFEAKKVCEECFRYLLCEFQHPSNNMWEVVKSELKLTTPESVDAKMKEILSLFRGQSSGMKNQSNVSSLLVWNSNSKSNSNPQMSGSLCHWRKSKWKPLWFVLYERVLYVHKASEDITATHTIPVLGYRVVRVPEGEYEDVGESKTVFKLVHQGGGNIPPYVFATDTQCAESWIRALEEATQI